MGVLDRRIERNGNFLIKPLEWFDTRRLQSAVGDLSDFVTNWADTFSTKGALGRWADRDRAWGMACLSVCYGTFLASAEDALTRAASEAMEEIDAEDVVG
jgi:hypothetical protein